MFFGTSRPVSAKIDVFLENQLYGSCVFLQQNKIRPEKLDIFTEMLNNFDEQRNLFKSK
jgi:hypothetical protein